MRRLTSTLFIVYAMLTLGVFVAAVISPAARALAYAPLRDLVLPGPEPIVVSVLYSTEKEAWLNEAAAGFEATRPLVNGHPVKLSLKSSGSRERLSTTDGSRQMITLASPLDWQAGQMLLRVGPDVDLALVVFYLFVLKRSAADSECAFTPGRRPAHKHPLKVADGLKRHENPRAACAGQVLQRRCKLASLIA